MSEQQPPSSPPASPKIPTGEELNAAATIDPAALRRWFSIPEGTAVQLLASRGDLDKLFLGLRMLAFAQGDHLVAFQLLSNGKTDEATHHFNSAADRHYQALRALTELTSALMAKAQVLDG
jgi:hypothetical protein